MFICSNCLDYYKFSTDDTLINSKIIIVIWGKHKRYCSREVRTIHVQVRRLLLTHFVFDLFIFVRVYKQNYASRKKLNSFPLETAIRKMLTHHSFLNTRLKLAVDAT